MPDAPKRGPLWLLGRSALGIAAFGILAAFLLAPRTAPDPSPLALRYIRQWQANPRNPGPIDPRLFENYKFTERPDSILAIPVDPRRQSFYAHVTGPIHVSPGSQAANADSPITN